MEIAASLDIDSIDALMEKLDATRRAGGSIYIMGNGGSAATASHFVNDFNKGASESMDPRFRFYCLNDNTSTIMAIANDASYDDIFEFQLKNYLRDGDLVIGISGGGNSLNVVKAIAYAKARAVATAAIVGFDGGKLAKIADLVVHVRSNNMQHVEDMHMILDHLMMSIMRDEKDR
jgi:D-sedoheptulose 7-phosphate isomerase